MVVSKTLIRDHHKTLTSTILVQFDVFIAQGGNRQDSKVEKFSNLDRFEIALSFVLGKFKFISYQFVFRTAKFCLILFTLQTSLGTELEICPLLHRGLDKGERELAVKRKHES